MINLVLTTPSLHTLKGNLVQINKELKNNFLYKYITIIQAQATPEEEESE
jgi:hypothetical protein